MWQVLSEGKVLSAGATVMTRTVQAGVSLATRTARLGVTAVRTGDAAFQAAGLFLT